ncbi:MAG: 3-dehydroquinate synthase II [Pseudomonadota bacterium]
MNKRFWVNIDPFSTAMVTAAIESGAEAVVVPEGRHEESRRLGHIATIAADGDLQWGREVQRIRIDSQEDEERVSPAMLNIIDNGDWTIIPLENLLAKHRGNLIQTVHSAEEAKIALQVMERGADGILLVTDDPAEVRRTAQVMQALNTVAIPLQTARITATRPVGMSDRCCIDTTSLLPPGEGLLVGNTADALFLVHNENVDSPYCAARPFRINAGAVHAYTLQPDNRTRYLAELSSGDTVLGCDPQGRARSVVVGRNKIERRPMLLISAENSEGREVSLIMQNAETVRLTGPAGEPLSVTALQPGDEVLAAFFAKTGRHFGHALEESIEER